MVSNEPTLPWRGHASVIHYGRLRLRIPDRAAGRGAELRSRRQRSWNEPILVYPESAQSVIVCRCRSTSSTTGDAAVEKLAARKYGLEVVTHHLNSRTT
jgi:hypothetical protein